MCVAINHAWHQERLKRNPPEGERAPTCDVERGLPSFKVLRGCRAVSGKGTPRESGQRLDARFRLSVGFGALLPLETEENSDNNDGGAERPTQDVRFDQLKYPQASRRGERETEIEPPGQKQIHNIRQIEKRHAVFQEGMEDAGENRRWPRLPERSQGRRMDGDARRGMGSGGGPFPVMPLEPFRTRGTNDMLASPRALQ